MFAKKNKVKIKFDVVVVSLSNLLSDKAGKELYISWKRGSKKENKGRTKRVKVQGDTATWEEPITIKSTMLQDTKTQKFDHKEVHFSVKEVKEDAKKDATPSKKKTKTTKLGSITVDLSNFAASGSSDTKAFPLPKFKVPPVLTLRFKSTWVALNGKVLVKKAEAGNITRQTSSNTLELEGSEYILKTSDELTDDTSAADDVDEELSSEDFTEDAPAEDDATNGASSAATPRTNSSGSVDTASSATPSTAPSPVTSASGATLDRNLTTSVSNLASHLTESTIASGEHTPEELIDRLKREGDAKMKIIVKKEAEIEGLRGQLMQKDALIKTLTDEVKKFKKRAKEAATKAKEEAILSVNAQRELATLRDKLSAVEADLIAARDTIARNTAEYEAALARERKDKDEHKALLQAATQTADRERVGRTEAERRLAERDSEVALLREQLAKAEHDAAARLQTLSGSAEERLSAALADASARRAELEQRLLDAKHDIEALRSAKAHLEAELERTLGEIAAERQSAADADQRARLADSQRREWQERYEAASREADRLRKELDERERRLAAAQQAAAAARKQAEEVEAQRDGLEERLHALRSDLDRASSEAEERLRALAGSEHERAAAAVAAVKRELDHARAECEELRSAMEAKATECDNAAAELSVLREERARLERVCAERAGQWEKSERDRLALVAELDAARAELQTRLAELKERERRLAEAEQEANAMRAQHKAEIDELTATHAALLDGSRAEVARLADALKRTEEALTAAEQAHRSEVATWEATVKKLEERLAVAHAQGSERSAQVDTANTALRGEVDGLRRQLAEEREALEGARQGIAQLEEEMKRVQAMKEEAEGALRDLSMRREEDERAHAAEVAALREDIERMRKEIEHAAAERDEKEREIAALTKRAEEVEAAMQVKEAQWAETESALKQALSQREGDTAAEELARRLEEVSRERNKLQQLVAELRDALRQSEENASRAAEAVRKLEDAERERDSLQHEVDRLKEVVQRAKTSAESSAEEKLLEKEEEIERLTGEVDALRRKLEEEKKKAAGLKKEKEKSTKLKSLLKRQTEETDSLKKDLAAARREAEEKAIVEELVYCAPREFRDGVPVSSVALVDRLVAWKLFDRPSELKPLMKHILTALDATSKVAGSQSDTLVFWLSYESHLIHLLKAKEAELKQGGRLRLAKIADPTLEGVQIVAANADTAEPSPAAAASSDGDEAGDTLVWFVRQLHHALFHVYSQLVKAVTGALDTMLVPCFFDAKNMLVGTSMDGDGKPKGKHPMSPRPRPVSVPRNSAIGPSPHDVISRLTKVLGTLSDHFIAGPIVQQLFTQLFYFINATLFNAMMSRDEFCTCTKGFDIKMGLSHLEQWATSISLLAGAKAQLKQIKDAANLLVMDKNILLEEDVTKNVFPSLNLVQIKHLVDVFRPDPLAPDPIPPAVVTALGKAFSYQAPGTILSLRLDPNELLSYSTEEERKRLMEEDNSQDRATWSHTESRLQSTPSQAEEEEEEDDPTLA